MLFEKLISVNCIGPTPAVKVLSSVAADELARRGVASPDDADGLALNFARPVAPVVEPNGLPPPRIYTIQEYAPFA